MKEGTKILAIIPARGGSKGLPGKNIKTFVEKPLIYWTIDAARTILNDTCICVSTDDEKIIDTVEAYGLKVPFKRPDSLSTDKSSTNEVILHAITFYKERGVEFDWILLLQPTSPLRNGKHLKDILEACKDEDEMMVSVKESHAAAVLCEENQEGFLDLFINKGGSNRQSVSSFYEYNGAIYLIKTSCFERFGLHNIKKRRKFVMGKIESIDIDDVNDFELAEYYKTKYKL